MKTQTVSLGICRDALCTGAGYGPVERYDGPGMFCPNCGELLQAYTPEPTQTFVPPPTVPAPQTARVEAPKPASTAPSAPRVVSPALQQAPPPAPKGHRPTGRRRIFVWAGVLSAVVLASGVAVAGFLDHDRTIRVSGPAVPAIGVCGSSTTGRLAADIARGYAAQPQSRFKAYQLASANCDVRFFAAIDQPQNGSKFGGAGSVVARDGIVAIVNPQNPVASLSMAELRGIFRGTTRDWAGVGTGKGPISVYLPAEQTDEGRIVAAELLKGAPVGTSVVRLASSLDVVRAVAAANGRRAIGIVAFSASEPGKVLGIDHYPPASILSIAERKYPMTLGVHAWSNNPSLADFLAYASSGSAKAIATRDGFVP